jgi:hypothetical protein
MKNRKKDLANHIPVRSCPFVSSGSLSLGINVMRDARFVTQDVRTASAPSLPFTTPPLPDPNSYCSFQRTASIKA